MAPPSGEMTAQTTAPEHVVAQRMVEFIERSYAERTTLNSVSVALHGKPATLGRLFFKVVGVSVHGYVTRLRLEHAAHLVLSNVKVEAVALTVGYRSKKDFYRQFARRFGVTPDRYRHRPDTSDCRGGSVAARNRRVPSRENPSFTATSRHTAGLISFETRGSVTGAASLVATPYVVVGNKIQTVAVVSKHVELLVDRMADAVEPAAMFLEHKFGVRASTPKRRRSGARKLFVFAPRA
jgi:AraC-like DNA-binding protein